MKRRHHLSVAIVLVLLAGIFSPQVDAAPTSPSGFGTGTSVLMPEERTVTVDGDDWQVELTMWAVERFEAAGLELPSVIVRFHPDKGGCGGWNGLTRSGGEVAEVDICRRSPMRVLLHELGHVWAFPQDQTTKDAFAQFIGADSWGGADGWHQRASEHAAEVIAWAISEGSVNPHTRSSDGFTELDHAQAFEILTGVAIPAWDGNFETIDDWQTVTP